MVVWPGDREGVRLAGVSRARGEKSGGQQGERTVRSVVSRESGLSARWSAQGLRPPKQLRDGRVL